MQGSSITLGSKTRGERHQLRMSGPRREPDQGECECSARMFEFFCTPKIYGKYSIFYFLVGGLEGGAAEAVCSWTAEVWRDELSGKYVAEGSIRVHTHTLRRSFHFPSSVVSSSTPSILCFFFFFPWPNWGGRELWRMCSFCGEATSSAGFVCKTTPSIPDVSCPTKAFNPKKGKQTEVADVGSFWVVSRCSVPVLWLEIRTLSLSRQMWPVLVLQSGHWEISPFLWESAFIPVSDWSRQPEVMLHSSITGEENHPLAVPQHPRPPIPSSHRPSLCYTSTLSWPDWWLF